MKTVPAWLRLGLAVTAVLLVGACAFGLWHAVVGGLVNGNPRAATFGLTLAAATGGALTAISLTLRHRRRA